MIKQETHVSVKKEQIVEELKGFMKENPTVMIVSIKNIPGGQFQAIKHKLRDKIKLKVLKKSLVLKALEGLELVALKKYVHEDIALVFSKEDVFELSSIFSESQTAAKAKAGQIALEDIIVDAGPTELVPGPAISELGAVGLKIKIQEGKIHIDEQKVIVKKGEEITAAVAGILDKLNILPFKVGFIPETAYESSTKEIYTNIRIDKEAVLEELKQAATKAFGFSINLGYVTEETIRYLLAKASGEEKALAGLVKVNEEIEKKEDVAEEKVGDKKEENVEQDDKGLEDKQLTDEKEDEKQDTQQNTEEEK